MNIVFNKVKLHNFMSFSDAEIDLDFPGFSLVMGMNENTNDNAESNGSGKCFGAGTKIQMYDGSIKEVEDIVVGDTVLGWDSTPRKVLEVHCGEGQLYKIEHYNDDYSYICNEEHELVLRTPNMSGENSRKIIGISVKDYIDKSESWKNKHNQFVMPMYYGEKREWYIPPYMLGVWLGDGNSNSAEICNADEEVIDYWKSLSEVYNLSIREYQKKNNLAKTVRLVGKRGKPNPIMEELKRLNVFKNKHIPHEYLTASYEDRMELLAGLLDTDGYWHINYYELSQVRENIIDDTARLARSLGFRVSKFSKFVNQKEYFYLYITGNHLHNIPMKVAHKKAINKKKQRADSISFNVKPVGYGKYYGFSIEGDGKFLLSNGLVVHNSSLFEAVTFALTGETIRGIKGKDILKQGKKEGYVTLWFTIDNDEYEITRSIS